MEVFVSVILPAHQPHPGRLDRTLGGLRQQTLPIDHWELLLIDNASKEPELFARLDLSWHPRARVVREPLLGLTHARLAGIATAAGSILVFVDDDNVLTPNYLSEAVAAFAGKSSLGAIGGKSVPEWEVPPPDWVHEFRGCLALRDLGEEERTSNAADRGSHPLFAPIGAGMSLRREAAADYARAVKTGSRIPLADRRGGELTSGGDNDIVLTLLAAGWEVGYRPRLRLTHLIPTGRTTRNYLARLMHGISRSWVQVLDRHGIRPWSPIRPCSVGIRKLRAFFRYRAWRDDASYVRWRGACGTFEGRATLQP